MLVDTHAHLCFPQFAKDREAAILRARDAGVGWIVDVGTDIETSRHALALAEGHGRICAAVGFHPHDAQKADEAGLAELALLLDREKAVAVGETGLDFYRDCCPVPVQEEVFRRHIRLARECGMPLVVHSRAAEDRTLDLLETEGAGQVAGVLHCFGGGVDQARRAADLGFCIGVGGTATYPNSTSLRVAADVPPERLVLETDCPYLAPVPCRGRRNEPAYIAHTADCIARARGEPVERLAAQTTANALRLFGLSE